LAINKILFFVDICAWLNALIVFLNGVQRYSFFIEIVIGQAFEHS